MTDDELERHLQAWFHAEILPDESAPSGLRRALAGIPTAVPSPLHRPAPRRRIGLLAVAAVVTTFIAGGLLVGSGAFRRPPNDPAFVAPTPVARAPASTATPVPTPVAPPGPCDTGNGQFLAGDTRPRSSDLAPAELSTGQGVYVAFDERIRSLWAVGRDRPTASVIAGATPPNSDVAVLDVGPHGVSALVRITLPPAEDRDAPCSGLYLVQLDGLAVKELTPEADGGFISGAAFSPNGDRIAYVEWNPSRVVILDATGSAIAQPCETDSDANDLSRSTVAWSPDGTRIAAECNGLLFIVDPTGATPPVQYPRGDYSVAFQWTVEGALVVARDPAGLALRGLHVDSFDVASQTATVLGRVDASNLEDMFRTFRLSPDGRWLVFQAGVLTAVPMDQIEYVGYIVPVTGGVPTPILTAAEADSLIGWSTDSRALVFLGPEGAVTRMDVDTLERTVVGTVPLGYEDGFWRIP